MNQTFEQIDEFFIEVEEYDNNNIIRYEWLITKDPYEFHSCNSGWKYISHIKMRQGGLIICNNKCEECNKNFYVFYKPHGKDIINKEDFRNGNW